MKGHGIFIKSTLLLSTLLVLFFICNNKKSNSIDNSDQWKLSKQQRIDEAFELEYIKTHDPNTKSIPSERLLKARKIAKKRLEQNTKRGPSDVIPNIEWEERGPDNIGGRTRAILVDASDNTNNTVLAGGVAGGIWKTTNFQSTSPTWTKVDDFFENLAVTTIAQDPNNLDNIYFGTGEGWYNADAARGLGIWKSTDGGDSFTQLASTNNSNFYYVQDIVIDNNGSVFAATSRGIFKSSNDGSTWTKVLSGSTNFFADMELGSDGDIYATSGRIFDLGKVWKSDFATHGVNTGNSGTWTDISPTGDFWRIELATAPSNSNRVYLLCQEKDSFNVEYIYRSDNAGGNSGTTWTSLPVPTIVDLGNNSVFTRYQAWYDLIAQVDPNDDDVVYIGGVDALRSTDAGASWTQMTTWSLYGTTGYTSAQKVHADHHNFIYMPNSSSEAILTTDGGVFHTTDANNTGSYPSWQAKNSGYNITQFYACATSNEANGNQFLAGAQDNGSQRYLNEGMNTTTTVSGGDGGFCHIDEDNPNIQITSYVRNNYYITNTAWSGSTEYVFKGTGRFINPTDYDSESNILYGATDDNKYSYIRNVGTSNTYGTTSLSQLDGQISAVTVSPNTSNRVFFAAQGGNILRVDNAHTDSPSATLIGSLTPSSNAYISSIAVERGDDDHLLVTFSNYGINSIYETLNGGSTWTSVEGDLPDMPVRWAEFNPNTNDQAILATELGVWTTNNLNGESTKWGPSNTSLANTRVDMIQIRPVDNFMLAATHGRGLFTSESLMASNLPATLETFIATKISDAVELNWITASEQNNDYFEVLHSRDGITFSTIGQVKGNGTTLDQNNYSITHENYHEGINYYQLKQVDFDGNFEMSDKVSVFVESDNHSLEYTMSPNPVQSSFTLTTPNNRLERIIVNLYNTQGQLLKVLYDDESRSDIHISLVDTDLESGLYLLELRTNTGGKQIIKMMKE